MKKQLQKRFTELQKSYQENLASIEHYLAAHQNAEMLHANESQSSQKQLSEHFLFNASLKKRIDDALKGIEFELSKDENDINYEATTERMRAAETDLNDLVENPKPTWKRITDSFFFQLLMVFLLKTFVFGWYCVPTGSAEPTLLVGDRILVNKTAYWFSKVKRGDTVVFDNPEKPYSKNFFKALWQRFIGIEIPLLGLPEGPDNFTKRVLAIPGDIVEGKIEDGKPVIYVNGKKLEEPYVNPYPLMAVQKINGFVSPQSGIGKALLTIQRSNILRTALGLSVGALYFMSSLDLVPEFGKEVSAILIGVAAMWGAKMLNVFVKRKSENCGGHPSWYTYVPDVPYGDQPYYKVEDQEVVLNPFTKKPFFRHPHTVDAGDVFMPFRLPENMYWCQGDSRKNSKDCRYWGPLDGSLIRAKAGLIVYSINSEEVWWLFDILKNPIDFWTKKLRAERSFKLVTNTIPQAD